MTQQIHSWVPPQEKWKHFHTDLYTKVRSSGIHYCQKVKMAQMSVHRWIGKQNVYYPHSGILRSHGQEWSPDTRTAWTNPKKKLCWLEASKCRELRNISFPLYKMPRKGTSIQTDSQSAVAQGQEVEIGIFTSEHKYLLELIEMF